MFARFKRARPDAAISTTLYGAIVAQARNTALYTDLAVPDTVEGRFEMVVAHMALVLARLSQGDASAVAVSQGVFDVFCVEMDDALRSMGVKDTSVGKRMRSVGEAFYGRAGAYDAALAKDDRSELAAILQRTVYGGDEPVAAAGLADYMCAVSGVLAATPVDEVAKASIDWPEPERAMPEENET